jgi:hypothetical protein
MVLSLGSFQQFFFMSIIPKKSIVTKKNKSDLIGLSNLLTSFFSTKNFLGTAAVISGILGSALQSNAQPYGQPIPPGPFVIPAPSPVLPAPINVPGKEVSFGNLTAQEGDRDQLFASSPGQALFFDGVNILPQSGLRNSHFYGNLQVDALSNISDILFYEIRNNTTNLLFSVQNDRWGNAIFAEHPNGDISLWSTTKGVVGNFFSSFGSLVVNGNSSSVIDPDPSYPLTSTGHLIDVDGLEVWGPEPSAHGLNSGTDDPNYDANVFSPEGDGPFSVKCVDALANCHLYTQVDIANAIGRSDLAASIDVDGLMTAISSAVDLQGKNYLEMHFSIRPIDVFDGAEIWTWNGQPGTLATPLMHGGHLWNTAFNLRQTLINKGFPDPGLSNSGAEVNLDAMEAASTVPGPLPVLGLASAFGFTRRLRRRISQQGLN